MAFSDLSPFTLSLAVRLGERLLSGSLSCEQFLEELLSSETEYGPLSEHQRQWFLSQFVYWASSEDPEDYDGNDLRSPAEFLDWAEYAWRRSPTYNTPAEVQQEYLDSY